MALMVRATITANARLTGNMKAIAALIAMATQGGVGSCGRGKAGRDNAGGRGAGQSGIGCLPRRVHEPELWTGPAPAPAPARPWPARNPKFKS